MSNEANDGKDPVAVAGKPVGAYVVSGLAIAALTTIELFALSKGINGTLQVTVMCVIAGIAGFNAQRFLGGPKKE